MYGKLIFLAVPSVQDDDEEDAKGTETLLNYALSGKWHGINYAEIYLTH